MRHATWLMLLALGAGFVVIRFGVLPREAHYLAVAALVAAPSLLFVYLPSIVLYGGVAVLVARILRPLGIGRFARFSLGLMLALMTGVSAAWWINAQTSARIASFVSEDRAAPAESAPERLALWLADAAEPAEGCGSLCQEILQTTEVR